MDQVYQTHGTNRVARAVDKLSAGQGLMVLWGEHGTGKSKALGLAAMERPEVRTVLMPPCRSDASPRSFFAELALGLDLEVGRSASGGQISRELAAHICRHDLLVVLDSAEMLKNVQMSCIRYLSDQVPRLALCGSPALWARVKDLPEIRTRVRLPVPMERLAAGEVAELFGKEFSEEAVSTLAEVTGGLWSAIDLLVGSARERGDTRGYGAEQIARMADAMLVAAA